MPVAPRRPCAKPGCGILGNSTYCETHTKAKEAEVRVERIKYDAERGTSASRGYTYRWSKVSKQYRVNHPLCVMCEAKGKLTPSQCVDHIVAVEDKDDLNFWNEDNWQALCNECHSRKTAKEDGALGNVKRKDRFI